MLLGAVSQLVELCASAPAHSLHIDDSFRSLGSRVRELVGSGQGSVDDSGPGSVVQLWPTYTRFVQQLPDLCEEVTEDAAGRIAVCACLHDAINALLSSSSIQSRLEDPDAASCQLRLMKAQVQFDGAKVRLVLWLMTC
jgi:hypothetical protein